MQEMEIDTCVGTPQMDRTSDVMTVQLLSPCQLAHRKFAYSGGS